MKKFRIYKQLDQVDCGPACLKMIATYHGKDYSLMDLREKSCITRYGVNLQGISEAAEYIGFKTIAVKIDLEQLDDCAPLPCILYWNQNHFVVLPPQNYSRHHKREKITIADPAHGLMKVKQDAFLKSWTNSSDNKGIALLFEQDEEIKPGPINSEKSGRLTFLANYIRPFLKKYIPKLLLGLLLGSLLSLILPFLTQSLIDQGLGMKNREYVFLILISQLAIYIGYAVIDMIRSWLLLYMNAQISVSLVSEFLYKLMKLPIKYFDTKRTGDIIQRIQDHKRIEQFLTSSSLNVLFSMINAIIFIIILASYNIWVCFIFLSGSFFSILWVMLFLKKRTQLDYARFQQLSENQNSLYEIVTGMQEIKLANSENRSRWNWEIIQAKLFKVNIRSLLLEQY